MYYGQAMEITYVHQKNEWIKILYYIYKRTLFNNEEGDPAICSSINETGGHYASKIGQTEKDTARYQLYMRFREKEGEEKKKEKEKNVKLIET